MISNAVSFEAGWSTSGSQSTDGTVPEIVPYAAVPLTTSIATGLSTPSSVRSTGFDTSVAVASVMSTGPALRTSITTLALSPGASSQS